MANAGEHTDWIQRGSGKVTSAIAKFNTCIHGPSAPQGTQGFYWGEAVAGNKIVNGEIAYNVMIALAGPGLSVSRFIELTPTAIDWVVTVHDNFFDMTDAGGMTTDNSSGAKAIFSSSNKNMVTGATILPS